MTSAIYFTYDGIPSERYGLLIADFDSSNTEENEAFSPSLTALKVPCLSRFFHGGVNFDSAPTFEFSLVSQRMLTTRNRSEILSWLVGRNRFLPLQFRFADLEYFTYYCVFTASSTIYVNGECHGFRVTATFDSPYARGIPTTVNVPTGTHTVVINNKSDIRDGYTYPKVETMAYTFDIVNTTDNANRHFAFSGLPSGENILIDNETKIITFSDPSINPLSYFTSKNWLRLRPGNNTLTITTNASMTIICPWYAMIGY